MRNFVAFAWLLLISVSAAQTASPTKQQQVKDYCEVALHPQKFDRKPVRIRATYAVNWEWGASLNDHHCDVGIQFLSPTEELPQQVAILKGMSPIPEEFANLQFRRDADYQKFVQLRRELCDPDFDGSCKNVAIEAEFEGVIIVPKDNTDTPAAIVVTGVAYPRMVRAQKMGTIASNELRHSRR